jgi:hypothetical protein
VTGERAVLLMGMLVAVCAIGLYVLLARRETVTVTHRADPDTIDAIDRIRVTCQWCSWSAAVDGPWENLPSVIHQIKALRKALIAHVDRNHSDKVGTIHVGSGIDKLLALAGARPDADDDLPPAA